MLKENLKKKKYRNQKRKQEGREDQIIVGPKVISRRQTMLSKPIYEAIQGSKMERK